MVKATELRIGNYLLDNKYKEADSWIAELSGWDIDNYSNNKCFDAIPLTPEILEKFGFEKSGLYWIKKDNWIRIWEWGIVDVSYHTERLGGDYEDRAIEIKYLHQLQNLYFALTGEELEINL